MRPLKVLTWHTHGSYLYYLSQAPHEFYVLSKPGRPPGYGGRCGHIPWGDNVHDMPLAQVRSHQFDCIVFQEGHQYRHDRHAYLSASQRTLPRIYIEHNAPQGHPTDTVHPIEDPNMLLVHVTHFNALMWECRNTPTRVIEHGVRIPAGVAYRGDLARGLVVINHLARRGRRLGADLYRLAGAEVPLELIGMDAEALGGLGEIEHAALPAFAARYRFLFSPIRYGSLSLSVIEAMMAGLPIVALATTEMATVIDNGESGFIDTNLDTLLAGMHELLREPVLARRLGERARQRARERFGIERFSADWDAALRHVCGA
jgi:hypothetical protein